jgi:tetratricopeptide (TPR) repeat protein
MERNTPKLLMMSCSLAVVVSTLAGSASARGTSGGHPSGGTSHFGRSTTSSNFVRTTRVSGVNRVSNFRSTAGRFVGTRFRSQRFTTRRIVSSRSPYWRSYGNWGTYWGLSYTPAYYGWAQYQPIPVVAYRNPYCACAGNVVDGVDYSVPINGASANTVDADDSDAFQAARAAYAQGDFNSALKAISIAAQQSPHDQDIHQFHALVLFALGDYCKAATVTHAVLEQGPGWTWDTLHTLYPSPEVYTTQLRRLEHFVSDHPSQADVRLLLGYHYLMLNHSDSAERQLSQVVSLEPKDRLAANILAGMKNSAPAQPTPMQQPAPVQGPAPVQEPAAVPQTGPMQPIPQRRALGRVAGPELAPESLVPEVAGLEKAATNLPLAGKVQPAMPTPAGLQPQPAPNALKPVPEALKPGQPGPVEVKPVPYETEPEQPVADDKDPEPPAQAKTVVATKVIEKAGSSTKVSPTPVPATPTVAETEEETDSPTDEKEPRAVNATPVVAHKELVPEAAKPAASNSPLTGTFKANPAKGVQIEVTLRDDKTFTWKFTTNGKTQSFTGKYVLGASSLVLTREDGESMDGNLERGKDGSFKFRMKDADADDPGLTFLR